MDTMTASQESLIDEYKRYFNEYDIDKILEFLREKGEDNQARRLMECIQLLSSDQYDLEKILEKFEDAQDKYRNKLQTAVKEANKDQIKKIIVNIIRNELGFPQDLEDNPRYLEGFNDYDENVVKEFLAADSSRVQDSINFKDALEMLSLDKYAAPDNYDSIAIRFEDARPFYLNVLKAAIRSKDKQAIKKAIIDIIRDKYELPNKSGNYEIKDHTKWWKLMRLLQRVPKLDEINVDRAAQFVDKFKDEINPGELVLDVGSGGAHVSEQIAKATGAKVFPTDITKPVDTVNDRGELQQFAYSTVENLPYKNGSFDKVTVVFVLHHLTPDAQASALKELYRVLKPGGKLIIIEDIPKEGQTAQLLQQVYDSAINTESLGEHHSYKPVKAWEQFFKDVIGDSNLKLSREPEEFGSDLRKDETQHSMFVLQKTA